jgi:glycosyltransferase involved in cell wall biosynthesis
MRASDPLVSVVTPVFNEEELLTECIESILAQTYSNWEYTIVDNCSTDASAEIARKYAAKDSRIRVTVNCKHLRAIENFNCSLRQISPFSKYCKIVLGDDWIFPECLEQFVAVAERHPSVGIVGAFALEGRQVKWTGLPYPGEVISGREVCRKHFLEQLHVFGNQNSVLYRADLVRANDPFYNEGNIHADTEACFALLRHCDFGFVHQTLTFTRLRPGSIATIAASLQTNLPSALRLLSVYGPYYLHMCVYYRYLGKSLMHFRDRKFWNYHKTKLAECGVTFSRVRLARGGVEALCAATLKPIHRIGSRLKALQRDSIGLSKIGTSPQSSIEFKPAESAAPEDPVAAGCSPPPSHHAGPRPPSQN